MSLRTRRPPRFVDVVAHQAAAQVHVVGGETAVALLAHVQAADMIGLRRLLLEQIMAQRGVVPGDDLGHGVGEVGAPGLSDVMLDNGGFAAFGGADHDPRVADHRLGLGRGDKHQVDRLLDCDSAPDVHQGAILQEGGVERREAAELIVHCGAEQSGQRLGCLDERRGERAHTNPLAEIADIGEPG
jgi:hypothetical protein